MKRAAIVTSAVLLLGLSTGATGLGIRLDDCSALSPDTPLFKAYPELATACDAVVRVEARRYLIMNAELKQIRDDLLVLRFKGTTRDMALSPGAPEPIVAKGANGSLSPALPVGSPLKVYVPEDGALDAFAAPGERSATPVPVGVEEPLEKRIATYTCCPRRVPWYPIPEFLPMTGGPLPLLGLLGASLLGAGAVLRQRRLRRL